MLPSELSPNSASSCFRTSRGLPQGPLWVTSLLLVPQAPELPHPQVGSTNQLFVSGDSRSPAPSSKNTWPTKDPKTQICPMQLAKLHCPRDKKRTHSLSQHRISFYQITYIWDCWEMLLLHFLVRSLVTICASKLSYCQQLKKCGCQCVNTK